MSLADRATIANMAPEYGATCGFFPVDDRTLEYLRLTGRPDETIALVEAYAKAQGMWRADDVPDPIFTDTLELDMASVTASLAGPKRPQDRVSLDAVDEVFNGDLLKVYKKETATRVPVEGLEHDIGDGDVVIAAITSCTNTSNPSVLIAAGLVARKARALGLTRKPWVKTSLAPGSQVVTDYLDKAGLSEDLDAIGFNLVGYGCTTCIGNSGPLSDPISAAINGNDIVAASVLSGNRNFEGRVSSDVRANFLASPPLVVAYALKGTVTEDMIETPARRGHRRPGLPQGRVAQQPRDRRPDGRQHRRRHVPRALRQRLPGRPALERDRRRGIGHLSLARGQHLHRQPALFRGDDDGPRPRHRHRRGQAAGDSWATASPPTTSARRAASRRTAPRASSSRSTRSPARTSTATARGAATTRS